MDMDHCRDRNNNLCTILEICVRMHCDALCCSGSYINVGYEGYFGCNFDVLGYSCRLSNPLLVNQSYLQVNTYLMSLLHK